MLKSLFIFRNSTTKTPKIQHVFHWHSTSKTYQWLKTMWLQRYSQSHKGRKGRCSKSHPPPDRLKTFQIANNFTIIIAIKLPMASEPLHPGNTILLQNWVFSLPDTYCIYLLVCPPDKKPMPFAKTHTSDRQLVHMCFRLHFLLTSQIYTVLSKSHFSS